MMTYQRREDGLLVQEVGDELVVYDQGRDRIHALNPTTARVWRHCDGQTSITEMAILLANELSLTADEDLVWLTLDQLDKAHLLQEPLGKAIDAGKVSRREVIRKLALGGSLALLMPVIDSITAPTPAMAESPPNGTDPPTPEGCSCFKPETGENLGCYSDAPSCHRDEGLCVGEC
jgi:hypothetical protein